MSVAQDLRAARALIATPEQWCQGAYAAEKNGRAVHVSAKTACRFCALGAIDAATGGGITDMERLVAARDAVLAQPTVKFNLPVWNDDRDRTHAEVLAAFDGAIEEAEMLE